MDFNSILNQVLDVAKDQIGKTMESNSTVDKITKAGGGAAAIGILSMILGRNGGAGLTKLGSLAALGSLAYQAYQQYQQSQSAGTSLSKEHFMATEQNTDADKLLLQVMIAAANADGAITDDEKQAIVMEAGNNPEVYQWLQQEVNNPISIAEIAKQVNNNPALAAQVYLAARVACAELDRKEIVFLANLAQALNLDDQLIEQLEKQAGY
ncbi:tellurite resistance TerB family protein [Caviibacterium pharyngocola]|uniref:DUF533 domain-containing protein n=1 Tax=Caviibacterium pharyngocola TaxID=28159 RepID=A0A2M8RUH0_9PAST|nr:tellurite resistance TerB family protein [Caviibacterium pharyngocola]PJG82515.1 DUF533 domain-containing protein [Caviibacterium pharyngocola]